jgi:hypothetical protein
MRAVTLGAISAAQQSELNATEAAIEELHAQAYLDLSSLADQGYDTTAFKAELDALASQIYVLRADIQLLPPDDPAALTAWQGRADALHARVMDLLRRTGAARAGAPELAQLRGLVYLVAAVAGAGAIGAWVWKHRRKMRSRRR